MDLLKQGHWEGGGSGKQEGRKISRKPEKLQGSLYFKLSKFAAELD